MSTVLKEIQAEEMRYNEAVAAAKEDISTKRQEYRKKADSSVESAKKEADSSFSSKMKLLNQSLEEEKSKGLDKIKASVDKISGSSSELIKKGKGFLVKKLGIA